jgi:hypothetical protein
LGLGGLCVIVATSVQCAVAASAAASSLHWRWRPKTSSIFYLAVPVHDEGSLLLLGSCFLSLAEMISEKKKGRVAAKKLFSGKMPLSLSLESLTFGTLNQILLSSGEFLS